MGFAKTTPPGISLSLLHSDETIFVKVVFRALKCPKVGRLGVTPIWLTCETWAGWPNYMASLRASFVCRADLINW